MTNISTQWRGPKINLFIQMSQPANFRTELEDKQIWKNPIKKGFWYCRPLYHFRLFLKSTKAKVQIPALKHRAPAFPHMFFGGNFSLPKIINSNSAQNQKNPTLQFVLPKLHLFPNFFFTPSHSRASCLKERCSITFPSSMMTFRFNKSGDGSTSRTSLRLYLQISSQQTCLF